MRKGLRRNVTQHAIIVLLIMIAVLAMKSAGECEVREEEAFPQATITNAVNETGSTALVKTIKKIEEEEFSETAEQETSSPNENLTAEPEKPEWALRVTAQERYELAKLAMCEAEGESGMTKALIIFVVVNRVASSKFPDNIHDVIFQKQSGVYQFSPVAPKGRWWSNEPNDECYRIVDMVLDGSIEDTSEGALYFEACSDADNWHSRNLEYLYDSDNTRFYR